MRFTIILAALAFAPALGAIAADPAQSPAVAAAKASTPNLDPETIICKHEEVTGSRLAGGKICHTRKEWATREAAARDAVNQLENRANLVRPSGH